MTTGGVPAVEFINVHKTLGGAQVLKSIDLDVAEGEVICVLGPSGSGKTTLLRAVNGLVTPDAGYVRVFGEVIGSEFRRGRLHARRRSEIVAQRRGIGMVFQQFNLFPNLTALGNLRLAPRLSRKLSGDEIERRASSLLERVGLSHKADELPAALSGGQQQRVAIARALMMQPRVMLFDEPTSALDPELRMGVLEVVKDLARTGMTMLIATHEMEFARDVSDRIVFMDAGQIVELSPPEAFFRAPETERARQFLGARATA